MSDEKWVWKDNVYEVSSHGRVRSWKRNTPKILSPKRTGRGYLAVRLYGRTCYIHRLVLEAFVGPCPSGMECRHLDGNSKNNALENLKWGTPVENWNDKIIHGTSAPSRVPIKEVYPRGAHGEKQWKSKLTEQKVREIRQLLSDGERCCSIARKFNIGAAAVCNIGKGRAWKHVI